MFDISIGLDLATSASIVGASIAYLSSERKRRLAERQWRGELTRRKQVEIAHQLVDDVLRFIPVITRAGKTMHAAEQALYTPAPAGAPVPTEDQVARSIHDEFVDLRNEIEFGLLRPMEVRIDFVDGHAVWNREAARFRHSLDRVGQAMTGLQRICADPQTSQADKRQGLKQAVPLVLSNEPIGSQIDSAYSAMIRLAHDLKSGLLEIGSR